MQSYNLNNKVAIVTGASHGIGSVIAKELAKHGVKIILNGRNFKSLNEVKKEIISFNGVAEVMECDVSCLDSFSKVVNDAITNFGHIDILINNAGITKDNIIIKMKEDEWDDVLNINLKGCYNGIKSVSKTMVKNKYGRIINITSIVGQIGNQGQANYAASKAGIIGLTKSTAKELGSRNITVNAIAPGYISTKMTQNLKDEIKNEMKLSIPLRKFGSPNDIANLVCFLVSDNASYITGQTINVDGGMVMI